MNAKNVVRWAVLLPNGERMVTRSLARARREAKFHGTTYKKVRS